MLWWWCMFPVLAHDAELVGTGEWGVRPGRMSLSFGSREALMQLARLAESENLVQALPWTDVRDSHGQLVRDVDDVKSALDDGTSFVIRLEEIEEESQELAEARDAAAEVGDAAASAFVAPTTVHVYVTGRGGQALEPHTDPYDVLVIQLAGSKMWHLCQTPHLQHPSAHHNASLRETTIAQRAEMAEISMRSTGCTSHRTLLDHGALDDCEGTELRAGESLYLPKGLPHYAVATDDLSVHVTVGVGRVTWRDVFEAAMDQRIEEEDPKWRAPFPTNHLVFDGDDVAMSRDILASLESYCDRFFSDFTSVPRNACQSKNFERALRDVVFIRDSPPPVSHFPTKSGQGDNLRWLRSVGRRSRRKLQENSTIAPSITLAPSSVEESCDGSWVCKDSCDKEDKPCTNGRSCDSGCRRGRCDKDCDNGCPRTKSCDESCGCVREKVTISVVAIVILILLCIACPIGIGALICFACAQVLANRDRASRQQQIVPAQVEMTPQCPPIAVATAYPAAPTVYAQHQPAFPQQERNVYGLQQQPTVYGQPPQQQPQPILYGQEQQQQPPPILYGQQQQQQQQQSPIVHGQFVASEPRSVFSQHQYGRPRNETGYNAAPTYDERGFRKN